MTDDLASLPPPALLDEYERAAKLSVDFDNELAVVTEAKKRLQAIREIIIRLINHDPTL